MLSSTTAYVQRYPNDCSVFDSLTPFQVFSAPNYVDQAGNKGAFVRLLARNT
jgi:hypothetical protein